VAVPGARPGLAAGLGLAWGRALGEFGATLLFAGSLQGVTRTAPLAIFSEFSRPGGFVSALALSAVLIVVAAAILLGVKLLGGHRAIEAPAARAGGSR
jgi:molybdate transport system permease protein